MHSTLELMLQYDRWDDEICVLTRSYAQAHNLTVVSVVTGDIETSIEDGYTDDINQIY